MVHSDMTAGERAFTAWAGSSRADVTPFMWTWGEMPEQQRQRWANIAAAALTRPLSPRADPTGAGEAVAWRWRFVRAAGPGHWTVRQTPIASHIYKAGASLSGVEVQPLFTHPPVEAPVGVGGVTDAMVTAAVAVTGDGRGITRRALVAALSQSTAQQNEGKA